MAPLTEHQVVRSSPFAYCGKDLLGPLCVKIERSSHKHYVCIFKCLSARAVHLEIVQSLETDAFKQAFRRFCNRRVSKSKVLYSDNAGNFVMANKEINEGIKLWNSKQLQYALLKKEIEWQFNPSLASHQRRFYDAFFRLVRRILRSIAGESLLDEFDLLTLVTEIEQILNDRPTTELAVVVE